MKINFSAFLCFLGFFCLVATTAFSQGLKSVDSLKQEIIKHDARMKKSGSKADPMTDTLKVRMLDLIVGIHYNENPNNAMPYALQELELSQKLKYFWGIARSYNALGNLYEYRGEYAKALYYNKKALAMHLKKGMKVNLVQSYNSIGITYAEMANYPEALANLQKGLEVAKSINNGFMIFLSYNNIGLVYRNQKLYDKALQTYLSCLSLQLSEKESHKACFTYNNIGDIYLIMNKPDVAMKYLQEGLKRAISEKDLVAESDNYLYMGKVFLQKKDYPRMLEYNQKALKIATEMDNPLNTADAQLNKGYALFKLGDSQKAIALISEALKSFKTNGELDYIGYAYEYLTEIYKSGGNYKLAFENHVLSTQIKDSIFNVDKAQKFRELEVKFDLKNIKENAKVKEALAKKELQIQKNMRYYTFAGMLHVVIFLIILIVQRNKIAKIRRQKALHEERNRISRDLHDNLGAQLSTARMFMSNLRKKGIDGTSDESLNTSIEMLDNSISDLREIMNEIHGSVLHEKGYLSATEELVNNINKMHLIKFTLSHHNMEQRPDQKIEHEFYRITQELMNNTLKYAMAQNVSIELLKRDGRLILMYDDDGIGYDMQSVKRGNGFNNIESRVKSINGTVAFDAAPNAGARVIIEIPL